MIKRKKQAKRNRDGYIDSTNQATERKEDNKASSEQVRDRDRYSYAMTLVVITLVALAGGSFDFYWQHRQVSNVQPNNLTVNN